jgi:hypothetical protein
MFGQPFDGPGGVLHWQDRDVDTLEAIHRDARAEANLAALRSST